MTPTMSDTASRTPISFFSATPPLVDAAVSGAVPDSLSEPIIGYMVCLFFGQYFFGGNDAVVNGSFEEQSLEMSKGVMRILSSMSTRVNFPSSARRLRCCRRRPFTLSSVDP